MTKTEVEALSRVELRKAAKNLGIKYGKMSLMQIRTALVEAKPAKSKKEEPKVRKERTGTKMNLALKIMEDNADLSRKEIIKLFIDKAKLTKAGAATYYSLCQKKLKDK